MPDLWRHLVPYLQGADPGVGDDDVEPPELSDAVGDRSALAAGMGSGIGM
jgi:hypothetical protein